LGRARSLRELLLGQARPKPSFANEASSIHP
jgi:hypothetical protein